ncbi:MAG: imidazolonepropionase [Bacteroidetes bacterium]|nr:imidazolonepropionase [Bacteroidota bacterium]
MSETVFIKNIAQLKTPGPDLHDPVITLSNAGILIENGRISWVGPMEKAPVPGSAAELDATGQTVTPGLIDCHTHLVFAGDRSDEFISRTQGATYEEIAAAGGGIRTTVLKTRSASSTDLLRSARHRIRRWIQQGVTTLEIKTGYGLESESEYRLLRIIDQLKNESPIDISPTFMGAHDIPPDIDRTVWINQIIQDLIPAIAMENLAEAVDVFCEKGVYTIGESDRILAAARKAGLAIKVHADELTPIGGASLAARYQAWSADHLLCVTDQGIRDLSSSGTVAVLLPGTAFYLKKPFAPLSKLTAAGIPVALATDFNPGSCPMESLSMVMTLAALYMGMSADDCLKAVTTNAARALGRHHVTGCLLPGYRADLVIWNAPDWNHLIYHPSVNHTAAVMAQGRWIFSTGEPIECPFH